MTDAGAAGPANRDITGFGRFEDVCKFRVPPEGDVALCKGEQRAGAIVFRGQVWRFACAAGGRRLTEDLKFDPGVGHAESHERGRDIREESSGPAQIKIAVKGKLKPIEHFEVQPSPKIEVDALPFGWRGPAIYVEGMKAMERCRYLAAVVAER